MDQPAFQIPASKANLTGSEQLAESIATADFSGCAATVVGYGVMGRHYVQALRALGVGQIQVCSLSPGPLADLSAIPEISAHAGGFASFEGSPNAGEKAIVATPIADLVPCVERLLAFGFRSILIEKPVALKSAEVDRLARTVTKAGAGAYVAFNRLAYPSVVELASRTEEEGGIKSCSYDFTEVVQSNWPDLYTQDELAHWGIANSLHVIGLAHRLTGLPDRWHGYKSGGLAWHPSGSRFVGAGISQSGVSFSYLADWESKGRWAVEVHTPVSSYRLCPLERLFRKIIAFGEWTEVPVKAYSPTSKAGVVEQTAAFLNTTVAEVLRLMPLEDTAELTRFAEAIFGYTNQ